MKLSILGGVAMLFLWALLAFGLQLANGWVHVPLAVAVTLIVVAIVLSPDRAAGEEPTSS